MNKIPLVRMKTEDIADRRKLFELFTSIKNQAILDANAKLAAIANETVEVWTKMVFTFIFPQNHSHLSSSFCKCYSAQCKISLNMSDLLCAFSVFGR